MFALHLLHFHMTNLLWNHSVRAQLYTLWKRLLYDTHVGFVNYTRIQHTKLEHETCQHGDVLRPS